MKKPDTHNLYFVNAFTHVKNKQQKDRMIMQQVEIISKPYKEQLAKIVLFLNSNVGTKSFLLTDIAIVSIDNSTQIEQK